jgi:hypothetical protein
VGFFFLFFVFLEEEWKRYYQSLSEGYGAVGFTYEHSQQEQYTEYYQGNI